MQEVAKLHGPLPMPQRSITSGGVKHKLAAEQYSYYVQLSGKPEGVPRRLYSDAGMAGHGAGRAAAFLQETLEDFRKQARAELKRIYPELNTSKGTATTPPGLAVTESWLGF